MTTSLTRAHAWVFAPLLSPPCQRRRSAPPPHNGSTCLHIAAEHGVLALVDKLLAMGFHVEDRTNMVHLLPDSSAAWHARLEPPGGSNPPQLHLITINPHAHTHTPARRPRTRRCCPDKRVFQLPTAFAAQGSTPLHLAMRNNRTAVVKHLLEKGADIGAIDPVSKPTAHVADPPIVSCVPDAPAHCNKRLVASPHAPLNG
jgi:ankyrin repeat protein